MKRNMTWALGGAVLSIGLVATTAGCSGSDTAGAEGTGTVTAGTIPVTDAGPIVMGEEAGAWTDHGLDLTIETSNSSPNIISAVMAGDYQIGYGGVTAVFQAIENGIDLVIIAPASATSDDPEQGINDILVKPDSGIESAADLEGKKIAVNALGGYVQMLGQIAVDADGGDPDQVEWVELPVPDQPAALDNGTVDAFVAGEPFGTLGRAEGLKTVANPHALLNDEPVVAGVWYASRAAVEADPDFYADIVAAIEDSNELALNDDAGLRAAISEFTGIDPDLAQEIRLGSYGVLPLTVENLQPLADAALKFGHVSEEVDLDAMIWTP